MMMTSIVEEVKTSNAVKDEAFREKPAIPANTLVIGKKNATEYLPPAIFRISTTGELVIRARGSLSIVTAVDVAEIVKRNIGELITKSITIGTEEITSDGISRRMSLIEIHLAKRTVAKIDTHEELGKIKEEKVAKKSPAKKTSRKKKPTV